MKHPKTYAAALAIAFVLPIFTATVSADPYYKVVNNQDGVVEMRDRAYNEGRVICRIPVRGFLHRNHEQNWSRWIHVQWKMYDNFEWLYKDASGRWCPLWNRRGWIDKQDPDLLETNDYNILYN